MLRKGLRFPGAPECWPGTLFMVLFVRMITRTTIRVPIYTKGISGREMLMTEIQQENERF